MTMTRKCEGRWHVYGPELDWLPVQHCCGRLFRAFHVLRPSNVEVAL